MWSASRSPPWAARRSPPIGRWSRRSATGFRPRASPGPTSSSGTSSAATWSAPATAPARATEAHVGIASVFPGTGFDPAVFYKNELIGMLIWGDSEFIRRDDDDLSAAARDAVARSGLDGSGTGDGTFDSNNGTQTSTKSYYASLLTRTCTKIVNVPVLTDNAYIGINGCLGSLALGAVDNNRRFQGPPDLRRPGHLRDPQPRLHAAQGGAPRARRAGGRVRGRAAFQSAVHTSRSARSTSGAIRSRSTRSSCPGWNGGARRRRSTRSAGRRTTSTTPPPNNLGTDDPARIQRIRIP